MARPDVSISADPILFVGKRSEIEVTVTATKETKVDFIDASLIGEQGWQIGRGQSQVRGRAKFPELENRMMDRGILAARSTTKLVTSFTLPEGTPPTHALAPAFAKMRLRIHISIPWHLDGRYHYDFPVHVQAPRVVERIPWIARSTELANKARLEISLASMRLVVGETLVGTCAIYHLDDSSSRDVELSLVPEFVLHGRGRGREQRGRTQEWTVTIPAGSAGTGVPFTIPLPRKLIPSFETITHSLAWWLVASSGGFFGSRQVVRVLLELVDSSAAAERLVSAPRLGDERIALLFAKYAARAGWRGGPGIAENEESEGQFSIERDAGDCMLHLAYSYRGEDGTFLVARVDHLSLGLGLSVTPSSTLRHVFFKDVEIAIGAWDRAHHVIARSAEQAIPFLREVVPVEMNADKLGKLVRWNDGEIVFERVVIGVDAAALEVADAKLAELAEAITAARARIAPPEVTTTIDGRREGSIEDWHALAKFLDGRLTIGDLSIIGKLDGLHVDLGLGWEDARAVSVHVSVGDPEAAGAELRAIAIALPRPAADVIAVAAADQLVDQVTRWPADIVNLRVADGVASASYVLPDEPRPTRQGPALPDRDAPPKDGAKSIDIARVRELVLALRAVLDALDPGGGPYR